MKRTVYFIEIAPDKFIIQKRKPTPTELRDLRWGFANAANYATWNVHMRAKIAARRAREYTAEHTICGQKAAPKMTVDREHVARMLADSCEKYPVKAVYLAVETAA